MCLEKSVAICVSPGNCDGNTTSKGIETAVAYIGDPGSLRKQTQSKFASAIQRIPHASMSENLNRYRPNSRTLVSQQTKNKVRWPSISLASTVLYTRVPQRSGNGDVVLSGVCSD